MYATLFRHVLFPLYETRLRGRETLTRLQELQQSQWRPEEELRELSFRRMIEAIRFAEEHVPFYRRRFAEYGVRARDVQAPEDLLRLPALTRADIQAYGPELVAETWSGGAYQGGAGGPTDHPVRLASDDRAHDAQVAGVMRGDGWAGARPGDRVLHLSGRSLGAEAPLAAARRRLREVLCRERMICARDLGEEQLAHAARSIEAYRPAIVVGYATPLYHLARHALATGRRLPAPRGVISTAERLFEHQREVIERAFGAPVFDRYGCRETMLLASECERREGKHLNLENVFVEILRGGRHARAGEPGEVLVTDLISRSMPLIRYRNEDIATFGCAPCSCGRGLPLLASVEGRVVDMIVGPEGQLLAGEFFPQLIREYPGVDRFQVHQDRSRAITVRLLPGDGFSGEIPALIERELRRCLGEHAAIRVDVVDDIPLTPGGKHRLTVSEAPVDLDREATA